MLDALSAEALKIRPHKASWFLVWIYPAALILIFLMSIIAGIMSVDPPETQHLEGWIRDTAVIWLVPGNALGRYLMAAFVAVAFAGEYGWNTWKLIVPHRARASLIAAKYVVIVGLFTAAFVLSAAITVIGSYAEDVLTGDTIPSGITAGLIVDAQGKGALAAVAPAFLTFGYASLAAILTRSTLAGLVLAIVAISVEQLLFNFAPILYLKSPGLVWVLYHLLPGYHLANLEQWIASGSALKTPFPLGGIVALAWQVSASAIAAWIVGLAALTTVCFRRQDLN